MEPKEFYELPSMQVIDLAYEGVICASDGLGDRNNYPSTNENPFGN